MNYHRTNSDIMVWQETHSTPECEKQWENEWGGKIIFSHGTSAAKGIIVLMSKDIYSKVRNIHRDTEGRVIVFDLHEEGYHITIACIYAPNEDSPEFFKALGKILRDRHEHKVIIGDYNLTLTVDMDRLNTYSNNTKSKEEVENLCEEFTLNDVWRARNEQKKEFSWRKGGQYQKASRIDFALVSAGLDQLVEYIQYLSSIKTDHRAIYMVIDLDPFERGNGYWKFNNSLLQNREFLGKMNIELDKIIANSEMMKPLERWEDIKKGIKRVTTKFSRKQGSEDKLVISQLSEIVNNLEERLPLTREEEDLLQQTKVDLEERVLERTKGILFRSKVNWAEHGEKSTKYFFSLEKARYNAKTCYKLLDKENKEVTNPEQILKIQRQFYEELYSKDEDVEFTRSNTFDIKVPVEIKVEQDKQITMQNLEEAIKLMNNNKTPGEDGIPVDFYKVYWAVLKQPFYDMVMEAYSQEELHETARKGILNLIPKAGKDTRLIKNLRPITLLNTDYKIIEKAIANKMVPALETIIHQDQRGFMKERRISVNIRKMLDIIKHAEKEDLEAIVLSLDFVKCFDKCSFSILHGSLEFFGFGQIVKDWTKILYRNYSVKVQNNGYFSDQIEIKKGVHQGGCCSSLYFLVIAEILALSLRANQEIDGITIKDIRNILNQFADDMDICSLATEKSIRAIYEELDKFKRQSGFTVSYEKTSLYRIGSLRHSNAEMYGMSEYVWTNEDITILGVKIAHQNVIEKNYEHIEEKVRKILNSWQNRGLTLIGKIQVVNTLIASLFVYKMMVLPRIPKTLVKRIDNIIREFIWNKKKAKIAYKILQLPKKEGGLGLTNLVNRDIALKASWPIILWKEHDYAQMVFKLLRLGMLGENIWRCTLKPEDIQKMKLGSDFWEDVLEAWSMYNYHQNFRIGNQLIWNNSYIRVKGKPIYWEDVYRRGLQYVHQLFENKDFKSDEEVFREYGLTKLRFNSLKLAMPAEWKEYFRQNVKSIFFPLAPHNFDLVTSGGLKNLTRKVYQCISGDCIEIHNKYIKWRDEIGQNLVDTLCDYRDEHRAIYKTTNIVKYRSFQYRILQRGLVTNIHLYKWGLKPSEMCYFCKEEKETISHMIWGCEKVQEMWKNVYKYIETRFLKKELVYEVKAVILNKITEPRHHVANFVCLIVKQYIYRQRCQEKEISFQGVKAVICQMENIEKYIAMKNGKIAVHYKKWSTTPQSDECSNLNEYIREFVERK